MFGRDTPVFGYYSGGEIVPAVARYDEARRSVVPVLGIPHDDGHPPGLGRGVRGRASCPSAFLKPRAGISAPRLERSETTLDRTESILANLSRKSYEDGAKLRRQSEVIRRYTPHGIWAEVGLRRRAASTRFPTACSRGHSCSWT